MQNTYQNGAKLDVKSHPKSMPKLVTDEIIQIIKKHVFLKCKIM